MNLAFSMLLLTGGAAFLLSACAGGSGSSPGVEGGRTDVTPQAAAALNALTAQEKAAGWRLLFDGKTTAGWRGYRKTDMPPDWQVVDGALTRVGKAGDIVTVEQFGSFELAFDWSVAPGGNSGVFFRVTEDSAEVWHSGPEFQILDNAAHKDGLTPATSAGADYALHAPTRDVTRLPGTWNEARIVVRGNHVEHWLNGEKIVEYELGSADWTARVAKSKFNKHPGFGRAPKGHIALQDHGDRVAFRNIKIKPLGVRS
jgi:hypothetical protein